MTTRTRNTLGCLFALGMVLLAFCTMDRRGEAEEAEGYPEVVQEVVSPKPVPYVGDSIRCPGTDLGEYDCYTVPLEAR